MGVIFYPLSVPGLSHEHGESMSRLLAQLRAKSRRNRLRREFYDYKQVFRDLGISLPPSMIDVESVLGWPAKAVDARTRRNVLDEWQLPDGLTVDDIGLSEVYGSNQLETEIPAALTSTLVHAVSFGFVHAGDVASGEPESILTIKSAEEATGTWDARRRCLSEALMITARDIRGMVTDLAMFVPNLVILAHLEGSKWSLRQVQHDMGVPVEPIPFKPLLDRPFGSSCISRPIMGLTDSGVRTLLRTEVGAEFYNAPQRYVLGADESAFKNPDGTDAPLWKVRLGAMLTLDRNENDELPQVGQFPQQSMTPNMEQFRMISQAFAAEASLPLRALGVVGENPESAESQQMAERELELEIRNWQKTSLTPRLHRLMTYALRIKDDSLAAREVYRQMRPHWKRPDTISLGMATDAVMKLDSISPGFGNSDVGLEMAGLEPDQIARYRAEQRRSQGTANLAAILDRRAQVTSGDAAAAS